MLRSPSQWQRSEDSLSLSAIFASQRRRQGTGQSQGSSAGKVQKAKGLEGKAKCCSHQSVIEGLNDSCNESPNQTLASPPKSPWISKNSCKGPRFRSKPLSASHHGALVYRAVVGSENKGGGSRTGSSRNSQLSQRFSSARRCTQVVGGPLPMAAGSKTVARTVLQGPVAKGIPRTKAIGAAGGKSEHELTCKWLDLSKRQSNRKSLLTKFLHYLPRGGYHCTPCTQESAPRGDLSFHTGVPS